MTEPLRARLDEMQFPHPLPPACRELLGAITAVLDLHRRVPARLFPNRNPDECSECREPVEGWDQHPWPCPTIVAIADALGVSGYPLDPTHSGRATVADQPEKKMTVALTVDADSLRHKAAVVLLKEIQSLEQAYNGLDAENAELRARLAKVEALCAERYPHDKSGWVNAADVREVIHREHDRD